MFANNPLDYVDGTENQDSLIIFDRFGELYSAQDVLVPFCTNVGGEDECIETTCSTFDMGNFEIELIITDPGEDNNPPNGFPNGFGFADGTTVAGSNLTLGEMRQETLCQVFTDMSHLISTGINKCGGTKPVIRLEISSFANSNINTAARATPYYYNVTAVDGGITHNSVWRYLNGGTEPLTDIFYSGIGGNEVEFFHGKMEFNFAYNFAYDLTTPEIEANQFDFYSAALHEFIHLLGFTSMIKLGGNGTVIGGMTGNDLYTRYDTYLRLTDEDTYLIIEEDESDYDCHDFIFNPNLLITDPVTNVVSAPILNADNCNTLVFDGSWNQPLPIAKSNFFNAGHLSHLQVDCYYSTSNFVMNIGYPLGMVFRTPTPEDVSVLCDIGYTTTGKFGDGTDGYEYFHIQSNQEYACGEHIVAGVDDPCEGSYNMEFCDGAYFELSLGELAANDQNVMVNSIGECFVLEEGDGVILNNNPLQYLPSCEGLHIISYVADDGKGEFTNTTFIYIDVIACPNEFYCNEEDYNGCDLICNHEFNHNACPPVNDTGWDLDVFNVSCDNEGCQPFVGWSNIYGTPDYSDLNNTPHGSGQIRLWAQSNNFSADAEGIQTPINLSADTHYLISYTRSINQGIFPEESEIFLDMVNIRLINQEDINWFVSGFGLVNSTIPSNFQQISQETDLLITSGWGKYITCFQANSDWDRLIIYPQQLEGNARIELYLDEIELIRDDFITIQSKTIEPACDAINLIIGEDLCMDMEDLSYTWEQTIDDISGTNTTWTSMPNLTTEITVPVPSVTTHYRLSRTFPTTSVADNIPIYFSDVANVCSVNHNVIYTVNPPTNCCEDLNVDANFGIKDVNDILIGNSSTQNAVFEVCLNELPLSLFPVNTTLTGTFSANVNNNIFATTEIGTHEISYTIIDVVSGCEFSSMAQVKVLGLPNATFEAPNTICQDSEPIQLMPNFSGEINLWSGMGVSTEGVFDPLGLSVGVYEIELRIWNGECNNNFIRNIEIIERPDPSISNLLSSYCLGGGNVIFPSNVVSAGGNGLLNGENFEFSPSLAGLGIHPIKFIISGGNGCFSEGIVNVEVLECCPELEDENTTREQVDCCLEDWADQNKLINSSSIGVSYLEDNYRYTVTNGGDWTPSNHPFTAIFGAGNSIKMNVDLVIPDGVDLDMINMDFEFGPEGRIIVERGGELTIRNCNLKGLCGSMWQGIQVRGNRSYFPENTVPQPGKLYFILSDIENAMIGIAARGLQLLDLTDDLPVIEQTDNVVGNNTTFQSFPHLYPQNIFSPSANGDIEAEGEIIVTVGETIEPYANNFINCWYGIYISHAQNSNDLNPSYANVKNANFTTNDDIQFPLQDIVYENEDGFFMEAGIFTQELVNAGAVENGIMAIEECTFTNQKYGIYSNIVANQKTTGCTFNNCLRGISADGVSGLEFYEIGNCTFNDCLSGIQAAGGDIRVTNSLITAPAPTAMPLNMGMLFRGSHFQVNNNNGNNGIENVYYGIVSINGGLNNSNEVRNNLIQDAQLPIFCVGNNSFLEIGCNDLIDYIKTGMFVAPVNGLGVLGPQGDCEGGAEEPAANLFATTNPNIPFDIWNLTSPTLDYSDVPVFLNTIDNYGSVNEIQCPISNYDRNIYCNGGKLASVQEIQLLPTEKEKDKALSDLYFYYKSEEKTDSAIWALEQVATLNAQKKLLAYKIEEGNLTAAQQILDNLPTNSAEEQYFVDYYQILLDIKASNRTYENINIAESWKLWQIAKSKTSMTYQAQNLLHLAQGVSFPIEIPELDFSNAGNRKTMETEFENDDVFTIRPNPIHSLGYIPYQISEKELGTLYIYDIHGNKLVQEKLAGNGTYVFDAKKYTEGIYFYRIDVNGQMIMKDKFIIVK